ncbi:hypothetical protein Mapa_000407 [Marchantia paleacea]|nr:hypothetical protein Mapa_000407 [Marchantia paleacea]
MLTPSEFEAQFLLVQLTYIQLEVDIISGQPCPAKSLNLSSFASKVPAKIQLYPL